MNRIQMALLASLILGSQAWAQTPPAPVKTIPEATKEAAPVEGAASETAPATSAPLMEEANDSCCGSGCCNLAHPWRNRRGGIGCDTCNTCDAICGPAGRVWVEFDYLYWRVGGDPLPALVTTSPTNPLTPVATAGVIPGGSVVVGNQLFNNDARSGLRLNMGAWLNTTQTLGFQFGGFMLQDKTDSVNLDSTGTPILARPFTNLQTNAPASQLVAYPDVVAGSVGVNDRNTFSGFDFAIRGNVCCGSNWRLDALLGYRYLRFTEQLQIQESLTAGINAPTAIGIPQGTIIDSFDRFDTSNEYHAVQVGVTGEVRLWEKLSLGGTAKASFGVMDQGVGIDGSTRFSTDNINRVGGLLALNSNIGTYRRSDTSLVPELILNVGYQFNDRIRLRVGYDLIYMPNVQRASSVIDTGIDPRRIPPITNPTINRPVFSSGGDATDLFIQGIHAGLEFRF